MERTKKRNGSHWAVVVAVGAAALTLSGCGGGTSEPTHESSEIRQAVFALSGSPAVAVASSMGRVTVRGQAGSTEVRVAITLHNRGTSIARAEGRVDEMVVRAYQEGNRVVLRYDASEQPEAVVEYGSVDFDVAMPTSGDVSVDVGNGAVEAENLEGTIVLRTVDGEIVGSDIAGTLDARTSNGRIDVTRVRGALRVDSSNGRLRMIEIDGSVDAETSHGNVLFSGRPIGASHRIQTSMGTIEVELPSDLSITIDATASGRIETKDLRLEGDTEGREWLATLNPPADATLELFTSNGRIEIRPAPSNAREF